MICLTAARRDLHGREMIRPAHDCSLSEDRKVFLA